MADGFYPVLGILLIQLGLNKLEFFFILAHLGISLAQGSLYAALVYVEGVLKICLVGGELGYYLVNKLVTFFSHGDVLDIEFPLQAGRQPSW